MSNYGGSADNILAEVSRPGLFSKVAERALVNSHPVFAMIAGTYDGEMSKKVKPAMQEETAVGAGYFENFVMLKDNGNITWRSRTEPLGNVDLDLGDRPMIPVQNIVGTIPLYQRDVDLNQANPDRLQDLIKLALIQAKDTANNLMGVGIFADGTGYGAKELWGLEYWLPDAVTTGSVAGISQADEVNWRPYSLNATSRSFATYGRVDLETLILETAFNGDFTDLIVMGNTNFGRLKALITAN